MYFVTLIIVIYGWIILYCYNNIVQIAIINYNISSTICNRRNPEYVQK